MQCVGQVVRQVTCLGRRRVVVIPAEKLDPALETQAHRSGRGRDFAPSSASQTWGSDCARTNHPAQAILDLYPATKAGTRYT